MAIKVRLVPESLATEPWVVLSPPKKSVDAPKWRLAEIKSVMPNNKPYPGIIIKEPQNGYVR